MVPPGRGLETLYTGHARSGRAESFPAVARALRVGNTVLLCRNERCTCGEDVCPQGGKEGGKEDNTAVRPYTRARAHTHTHTDTRAHTHTRTIKGSLPWRTRVAHGASYSLNIMHPTPFNAPGTLKCTLRPWRTCFSAVHGGWAAPREYEQEEQEEEQEQGGEQLMAVRVALSVPACVRLAWGVRTPAPPRAIFDSILKDCCLDDQAEASRQQSLRTQAQAAMQHGSMGWGQSACQLFSGKSWHPPPPPPKVPSSS